MKMRIYILLYLTLVVTNITAQVIDVPFKQATSVKYVLSEELKDAQFKKVVVDYNDIIYVLTDKGLFRDYNEDELSKDLFYRLLDKKKPVDICVQEGTGYLYYLYADQFLTNAHAGTIYEYFPKNEYRRILVNEQDQVMLLGNKKGALYQRTKKMANLKLPDGVLVEAYVHDQKFYYLTTDAIYVLENMDWKLLHKGGNLTALAFRNNTIFVGSTDGFYAVDSFKGQTVLDRNNKLPVPNISEMLQVGNQLWFGSENGAFLQEPDRFRYFAGRRWLDHNKVVDITSDSRGDLYFLTPTGLNKVKYITQTLAEKTKRIEDDIRKYHMRFGWVNEFRYGSPGDLKTAHSMDNDNDGLWTSLYLGSQAFKYAVTGEELAKRYVWESFECYERLLTVNPLKGFPARTFERRGIIVDDDAWRPSQEKDWDWKGTTSTDEYIAYLFVVSVMDKFIVKTAAEKQRITNFIDAIMTHIIENDYYFVDVDGKPTRWGRWNPEYVNWYPDYVSDRKLNSAHLIAGLQLAYHLTGKKIYKTEAFRLMEDHGYLENIMIPMKTMRRTLEYVHMGDVMGDSWNHSDDEMSFLTYWVLHKFPFNDELKQKYEAVARDHWELERPEKDGLWELCTYGVSGDIDMDSTLFFLREFNVDLDRYSTKNSHRKDLEFLPQNFRGQTTTNVLYPGEREMHRHNTNPFVLDQGGSQMSRLAGDEYLLPYWMARYYKLIE
ncbi:ligand-binding sensor domain-containing protein [Arenibacter troitsensis]|uniref:Two component regulator propeller n=1 Tax=Arenibacter troitsensis TaxID=188872 RepID=A0A1X7I3G1_9FLAO|nr:hypothetical protein [Arenibacter troitsensis]SMG08499.1 hypothetical protein SAMN03080602_00343 [Arenibacter troitsensis]